MRRIREILRLKYEGGATERAIARSIGVARSTVALTLERVAAVQLSWPLPVTVTDRVLEATPYASAGRPQRDGPTPARGSLHSGSLRVGVGAHRALRPARSGVTTRKCSECTTSWTKHERAAGESVGQVNILSEFMGTAPPWC
jgi:hypothetical protein